MSIEYLRAKALAYAPQLPYPIVLDREKKWAVEQAQRRIDSLQEMRDGIVQSPPEELRHSQRLDQASPTADVDKAIDEAIEKLEAAKNDARTDSLVLVFRRLPASGPGSYQEHSDAATTNGALNATKLGDLLLEACYMCAESADGEDVGIEWAEALTIIDHGDLEQLRLQIIGHHRVGASLSFDPRNSGQPATS